MGRPSREDQQVATKCTGSIRRDRVNVIWIHVPLSIYSKVLRQDGRNGKYKMPKRVPKSLVIYRSPAEELDDEDEDFEQLPLVKNQRLSKTRGFHYMRMWMRPTAEKRFADHGYIKARFPYKNDTKYHAAMCPWEEVNGRVFCKVELWFTCPREITAADMIVEFHEHTVSSLRPEPSDDTMSDEEEEGEAEQKSKTVTTNGDEGSPTSKNLKRDSQEHHDDPESLQETEESDGGGSQRIASGDDTTSSSSDRYQIDECQCVDHRVKVKLQITSQKGIVDNSIVIPKPKGKK